MHIQCGLCNVGVLVIICAVVPAACFSANMRAHAVSACSSKVLHVVRHGQGECCEKKCEAALAAVPCLLVQRCPTD